MARFTVVWEEDARNDLTDIWIRATDREAVAMAANEIDRMLSEEPQLRGIHACEGLRLFVVFPLRIYFFVRVEDRLVDVVSVKSTT
jgi:plasmid stabilization system protein ParE